MEILLRSLKSRQVSSNRNNLEIVLEQIVTSDISSSILTVILTRNIWDDILPDAIQR